jgi:flagellar hook-basal body complex protein FliE
MAVLPVGAAVGAAVPAPVKPVVQTNGVEFDNAVVKAVDQLEGVQQAADKLAVSAATGNLTDVHDYLIAATKASLATELTVAVRNKAVEAFNEIMRMQV